MTRCLLMAWASMVVGAASVGAAEITIDVGFDRWMYPFNATPGTRSLAPTFGAVGTPGFDERDGQFAIGFDTAMSGVVAGQGAANYQINSAKVRATHSSGAFVYDPTYDSYQTYNGVLADADPGRPIELYAVAFRGGFTHGEFTATPNDGTDDGFAESDPFAPPGPPAAGVRYLYPTDLVNGDVSSNVGGGFDALPLAIGLSTSGLSPGDPVPQGVPGTSAGETFEFAIDLMRPEVLSYLQQGLNNGGLFFAVTSLHETEMGGGMSPNFYTRDNFDPAAIPAQLVLDVTVVPEPGGLVLLGLGLAGLVGWRLRRRDRGQRVQS